MHWNIPQQNFLSLELELDHSNWERIKRWFQYRSIYETNKYITWSFNFDQELIFKEEKLDTYRIEFNKPYWNI